MNILPPEKSIELQHQIIISINWFLAPGLLSKVGYVFGLTRGTFNLHLTTGDSLGCISGLKNQKNKFDSINNLLNAEDANNTLEVVW